MVDGLSRAELAQRLGLSTNTVRTHTQNLLAKLDLHSALEAITLAMRSGMRPGSGL
jgi:DNA-binding CsgD family transcriptional regulator